MTGLADELELAEAKVAALKIRMAVAKCAEIGKHTMVRAGGSDCGCGFKDDEGHELPGCCSIPVHVCSV